MPPLSPPRASLAQFICLLSLPLAVAAAKQCSEGQFSDPGEPDGVCIPRGECVNGVLVDATVQRTTNECRRCNDGYFLERDTRACIISSCSHGIALKYGTMARLGHCESCDDKYYLTRNGTCSPRGSCRNGKLRAKSQQTKVRAVRYCVVEFVITASFYFTTLTLTLIRA